MENTNNKTSWFNCFSSLEERVSIDGRDQSTKSYYNFLKIKARQTSELGGKVVDDLLFKAKQGRRDTYALRIVNNIAARDEGLCYRTGTKHETVLGCIL